jgi:hypothetical protein
MRGKDVFSGTCLAAGILLKFMPSVILPFLVIDGRRVRFCLFFCCVVLVVSGFFISVVVWGRSTFSPLIFAATRPPAGSIYELFSSLFLRDSPNVWGLEKPLWLTAWLAVFAWSIVRQIGPALSAVLAVLVTLLFYRLGYLSYQMALYFLVSYWAVSEWGGLKKHTVLAAFLVSYFGLLGIVDIGIWLDLEGYGQYSMIVASLKFVAGCVLLASLIKFSTRTAPGSSSLSISADKAHLGAKANV